MIPRTTYDDTWGCFRLKQDFYYELPFQVKGNLEDEQSLVKTFTVNKRSFLRVIRGFEWSASGPSIDSEWTRRASCIHDALYSLMDKYGDLYFTRKEVDELFYSVLKEDSIKNAGNIRKGLRSFRAWYWYKAVRHGYPMWNLTKSIFDIF